MSSLRNNDFGLFASGSSGGSGTVTSIATTSPITGGTITSSGTLGITQSSSSVDGYLSSTDWNTFNNKGSGTVTSIATTSPITGGTITGSGTLGITQSSGSVDGYLSSTDWNTFNNKLGNIEVVLGYQGLGSTVKAVPLGMNLLLNIATATSLVIGRQILTPVYLATTSTITGVKWFQARLGNYTPANYNGVGLYSVSGSSLTLIASSTNDGNIWQTFATGTWGNKAFATPVTNLAAGTYYVSALYNQGGEVLAPQLQTITSSPTIVQVFDFTGSRLNSTLASQNTFPNPLALSGTVNATAMHWLSLY